MNHVVVCPQCSKKLAIEVSNPKASFRCPGCQQVTRIESALEGAKRAPPSSSRPADRPSTNQSPRLKPDNKNLPVSNAIVSNDSKLQVTCDCGTKLKVPATQSGRAVRCPKCQASVNVPKLRAVKAVAEPTPQPAKVETSLWDELPSLPSPSLAPSNNAGAYSSSYVTKATKRATSHRMSIWVAMVAGNHRYTGFFCLAIVLGPILSVIGCRDQQFHAKLDKVGITVPGEIQSGEMASGRKGRKTFSFEVTYTPKGSSTVTRSFNVGRNFFDQHTDNESITNDRVEVRYLPEQPNNAILIGGSEAVGQMVAVGILFFIVGIIALIVRVVMNMAIT